MIICRCDLVDACRSGGPRLVHTPFTRSEMYERRWRTARRDRVDPSEHHDDDEDVGEKAGRQKRRKREKHVRVSPSRQKQIAIVRGESVAARALRSIYHLLITIIPLAPFPPQHPSVLSSPPPFSSVSSSPRECLSRCACAASETFSPGTFLFASPPCQ